MLDAVYDDAREGMENALKSLKGDFKKVRTGRASLALFEDIRVDYYGTPTPLKQMASLSIPESRLVIIQPWDKTVIKEIEKEILKSELGLTPMNDGNIIRISIPPLTEDRRKDLVKQGRKIVEEHKVSIRNVRRDANELLKTMKKDGEIGEDDFYKAQEEIQEITDKHIKLADEIFQEKEKEILEF